MYVCEKIEYGKLVRYYKVAEDIDGEILCVTDAGNGGNASFINNLIRIEMWNDSRYLNKVSYGELMDILLICGCETIRFAFEYLHHSDEFKWIGQSAYFNLINL